MTLPILSAPAGDAEPLSARISAAHALAPAIKRIVALALYHRMLRLAGISAEAIGVALSWAALGLLLRQCATDLVEASLPTRALYFHGLADAACDTGRAMRLRIEARRPGARRGRALVIEARADGAERGGCVMRAAAWFYGTSFHRHATPAPTSPPAPVVHVDTRPRVDYVLPDRTVVPIIHDHGQYAHATCSYALAGGEIVRAIRADLLPQLEGTAVRS